MRFCALDNTNGRSFVHHKLFHNLLIHQSSYKYTYTGYVGLEQHCVMCLFFKLSILLVRVAGESVRHLGKVNALGSL